MGGPEEGNAHARRGSYPTGQVAQEAELKQPYQNVEVTAAFNPFGEAVVAAPVVAGRRKSWVPGVEERAAGAGQLGTFSNESDDSLYAPIDAYEGMLDQKLCHIVKKLTGSCHRQTSLGS